MNNISYPLNKIIRAANDLATHDSRWRSTGERIAAAFVLNRMKFLPAQYRDVVEAWDRLEAEWQDHVRRVKRDHEDN